MCFLNFQSNRKSVFKSGKAVRGCFDINLLICLQHFRYRTAHLACLSAAFQAQNCSICLSVYNISATILLNLPLPTCLQHFRYRTAQMACLSAAFQVQNCSFGLSVYSISATILLNLPICLHHFDFLKGLRNTCETTWKAEKAPFWLLCISKRRFMILLHFLQGIQKWHWSPPKKTYLCANSFNFNSTIKRT